jgi:hypothetical protein
MSVKVFDLCCDADHVFEGWFASQEEFEAQLADQKIDCPLCASNLVRRVPSAPRLNLGAGEESVQAVLPTGAQLQAMLVRAARQIMANTEDVGEHFAEEARKIHYKEVAERGIRGVASRDEARALEEEGVRVLALPFADLVKDSLH